MIGNTFLIFEYAANSIDYRIIILLIIILTIMLIVFSNDCIFCILYFILKSMVLLTLDGRWFYEYFVDIRFTLLQTRRISHKILIFIVYK